MTQQANVFDAMGQSFNALQGASDQRTRNQAGRAYASGDMAGATNAFAMGGMMQEAGQMRTQQRADESRERSGQMTDALRRGDHTGAASFAQSPEELQALQTFKQNASEQELAVASQRAGRIAAIGQGLRGIPDPQERLRRAQALAPQHGMNPADITLEMMEDGALDGFIMQAVGTEKYLTYQDRVDDNRRQDEQFAETRRHNQATEGVAQARVGVSQTRENRVGRGGGRGGGRSGGGASSRTYQPNGIQWD